MLNAFCVAKSDLDNTCKPAVLISKTRGKLVGGKSVKRGKEDVKSCCGGCKPVNLKLASPLRVTNIPVSPLSPAKTLVSFGKLPALVCATIIPLLGAPAMPFSSGNLVVVCWNAFIVLATLFCFGTEPKSPAFAKTLVSGTLFAPIISFACRAPLVSVKPASEPIKVRLKAFSKLGSLMNWYPE